jgi:hypothetical protein
VQTVQDRARRYGSWLLAAWFITISALRIRLLLEGSIGFDGRLYRDATIAWLSGADPWQVSRGGVYFAAPPPSMLPFVPLTWVPEDIAIAAIIVASLVATGWMLRRLRLPVWWFAFPPLVDGLWNANVHVLVAPLLVAGFAAIATLVKVYGIVVPMIRGEARAVALAVLLLLVTVPLLPWAQFVVDLPFVLDQLRVQSRGGMGLGAISWPLIVPVLIAAVVSLALAGRDRAAWLAVPVLWPSTQWYYGSLAIPGLLPFAAAVMALPIPGSPVLAAVVLAAETVARRRQHGRRAAAVPAGDAGTWDTPPTE